MIKDVLGFGELLGCAGVPINIVPFIGKLDLGDLALVAGEESGEIGLECLMICEGTGVVGSGLGTDPFRGICGDGEKDLDAILGEGVDALI